MRKILVIVNQREISAGTIEPGAPIRYWNDPAEHHMFHAKALDGQVADFYTEPAAEWWLTCIGNVRG